MGRWSGVGRGCDRGDDTGSTSRGCRLSEEEGAIVLHPVLGPQVRPGGETIGLVPGQVVCVVELAEGVLVDGVLDRHPLAGLVDDFHEGAAYHQVAAS